MRPIPAEFICAAEFYCLAESPSHMGVPGFVCTLKPNHEEDFHEARHVETGKVYGTWPIEKLVDTM